MSSLPPGSEPVAQARLHSSSARAVHGILEI